MSQENNRPRTSLLLFTRNEIEGLRVVFPKIPLDMFDEVLAIDGHSTDGTVEFLRDKGIKVIQQVKMGRGNAAIEGVSHTSGEIIVFLSSDGNEDPADIPKLLDAMRDADVAIASRFMHDGKSDDSDDPLRIRKLANRFVTAVVNLLWRAGVTDSTNGLRAIRRSAWNRLGIDSPYHETEFQMTIRAAKLGMKIREIPTTEGRREGGTRYASTKKMASTFTRATLREIVIGTSFEGGTRAMKARVRAHHNRISSYYEQRKREAYLSIVRRSFSDLRPQNVVDLGCGTGIALSWLEGEKVGVDFSQELLRQAHAGASYVIADVEATPFRDGSFDLVLSTDVAEHLPSLEVIDEAQRILSDGGILQLSTADHKYGLILELLERLNLKLPEGPHTWRRAEEVREKMQQAGFSCKDWSTPPIRFYRGTKLEPRT